MQCQSGKGAQACTWNVARVQLDLREGPTLHRKLLEDRSHIYIGIDMLVVPSGLTPPRVSPHVESKTLRRPDRACFCMSVSVFTVLYHSAHTSSKIHAQQQWMISGRHAFQAFDRLLGDGACQKQCAAAGLPIDLEWLNSTVTTNEVGGRRQPAAGLRCMAAP